MVPQPHPATGQPKKGEKEEELGVSNQLQLLDALVWPRLEHRVG